MATHIIRVNQGTANPFRKPVAVGDLVRWVGPPGRIVGIYFGPRTPLEWQSNNGPTVVGTVQKVPFGSYSYKPDHSLTMAEAVPEPEPVASGEDRPLADPELIVSGGVLPKRKRKATKRKAAKSTTPARRAKASKRAKPARRAKATKRPKAKRAKR